MIDLRDHPEPEGSDGKRGDLDATLLARVRGGDDAAYGELWARHCGPARRVAARLVPRADIEDLVSEAFERTLAAIRSGHGPDSDFFPYVARALRGRAATMLAGKARITLAEDETTLDSPVHDVDPYNGYPANARLAQAFQDLPARWQDALWVSVVQDEPPRRAAAVLGTSPNGVSALLIRARRRLRANFIDLSAAESRDPLCREAIATPARHAEHLRSCEHCETTLAGLAELDVSLRARGLPGVLVAGALAHVAAPHRRLRDLFAAVPAKVAVAAVAVTAAGVTAGPYVLAPAADTSATPGLRVYAAAPAPTGAASPDVIATRPALPVAVRATAPPAARPAPRTTPATRAVGGSVGGSVGPARPGPPATSDSTPARGAVEPSPAGPATRHPIGIRARADAACGCAHVTITGVRRTDRIVVRTVQSGTGTRRQVVHPSRPGTLDLTVAGRPSGSGRLLVTIAVVRANGRTVEAHILVRRH